jgi:hypothetical protein
MRKIISILFIITIIIMASCDDSDDNSYLDEGAWIFISNSGDSIQSISLYLNNTGSISPDDPHWSSFSTLEPLYGEIICSWKGEINNLSIGCDIGSGLSIFGPVNVPKGKFVYYTFTVTSSYQIEYTWHQDDAEEHRDTVDFFRGKFCIGNF